MERSNAPTKIRSEKIKHLAATPGALFLLSRESWLRERTHACPAGVAPAEEHRTWFGAPFYRSIRGLMMLSHVFAGVSDFERAFAFYDAVLGVLAVQLRFVDRSRPWAGWQSTPDPRPLFLIGHPFDGREHLAGNGQMVAFLASERSLVQRAHAVAMAHGGRCEGPPGLRAEYHANYYGAYFRDPDSNKLCVVCHAPP